MPYKDPAARAANIRAWKAANRERVKELGKQSYDRNREGILQRRHERRTAEDGEAAEQRREQNRQYGATYRERHHDELIERKRQRYADNPERERQYQATYRQRHYGEINERRRRDYAANPDPVTLRQRMARAAARVARGLTPFLVPRTIEESRARRIADQLRRRDATAAARVARGLPPFLVKLSDEERKARRLESERRWRQAHPDRARAAQQRWRDAHPEWYAEWAQANAARRAAINRAWHVANRDRRREQQRARYKANPQPYRNWAMAYLARKRGATIGPVDHDAIVLRDKGICQICFEPVAKPDRSFDHIIPLSLGGPHVQWNLRLTHFVCNSRRGAGRIPGQIYLPL